jgi:hypothetical protein
MLSVLAVAFTALCVGLTVRIISRRERWAKRATGIGAMLAKARQASRLKPAVGNSGGATHQLKPAIVTGS